MRVTMWWGFFVLLVIKLIISKSGARKDLIQFHKLVPKLKLTYQKQSYLSLCSSHTLHAGCTNLQCKKHDDDYKNDEDHGGGRGGYKDKSDEDDDV